MAIKPAQSEAGVDLASKRCTRIKDSAFLLLLPWANYFFLKKKNRKKKLEAEVSRRLAILICSAGGLIL